MDEARLTSFATEFQRFLEVVNRYARTGERETPRARLEEHLGTDPTELPVVADSFPQFEHVNVQIALETWLGTDGRSHELAGLVGAFHPQMSFADLIPHGPRWVVELGAVGYTSLAVGPGSTRSCVQQGIYLVVNGTHRDAIFIRGPQEHLGPNPAVSLEVLSADQPRAQRIVAELRRLTVEHSVFRGQVISFATGPFGEQTAGPIAFHERPQLPRDQVILPARTFTEIEDHVFGIAAHRERLRASGQHLKRGLLLHGPPGTGKTLTSRYQIGQLRDHTVVILSGGAIQYIEAAATLARSLAPVLVVLEDVDLVAGERMPRMGRAEPLPFALLNVMDGLDEDADLIFLLTTNRADALEPALAARPGRVDAAVEIALPDADARRRLLDLYGAGVDLRLAEIDAVVARTEGVTASLIKELVRKAALVAARGDEGEGRIAVSDEHVREALDELLDEGAGLTRALLGIARDGGELPPGPPPPPAGAWFSYAPHGRPATIVTRMDP